MPNESGFDWAEIETALQELAVIVHESAVETGDIAMQNYLKSLASEIQQNTQQFGAALANCNGELDAEQKAAQSLAEQTVAECETQIAALQAEIDSQPPRVEPPPLAEPEADPGPRLSGELLDRYGIDWNDAAIRQSAGWQTWMESSGSQLPAAELTPEAADAAWRKHFDSTLASAPIPQKPTTAPPPSEPPNSSTPEREPGWSTWLEKLPDKE